EMCSCVYVSGLSLEQCLDHANLPMSRSQLNTLVSTQDQSDEKSIRVRAHIAGEVLSLLQAGTRYGRFKGEGIGCRLEFPEQENESP
ncbi:MAG TPA: hypothetical protein VN132_07875, partial [Bdellovibrio sp.]|nr:hypothetical protein [Bdellovibrio sp.]